MTTASISTTKNHLSALLDQVRHGQRVVITDRGIPVAMLVQPDAAADADSDGRIQRLRRMGIITGGSGHINLQALGRPERLGGGADSLSRALQQEREESR
ncbi:MAG: type II toxin-antitoxin system prevent-host-death family antitoxin [bacterium]